MFDVSTPRRRMFSPWTTVPAVMAVVLAAGVFSVTQAVKQREDRIAAINRGILAEQQTMRVLDAEWAYLTRPQRLEELMAMRAEHENGLAEENTTVAPVAEKTAIVARTEPAAGTPAPLAPAAPVAKTDAKVAAESDADDAKAKDAVIENKPAGKDIVKTAKVVKKSEASVVKARVPDAGDDLIWSVKHSTARQQTAPSPAGARKAPVYPQVAAGKRGGIAHPIVE